MDPRTDGVTMTTTSGWRSPQFQQRLLDNAVTTYGGQGADQWLIDNGSPFGLCRICANELWHFELAIDAAGTSVWPHDGTGLGCNAFDHRT